MTERSLAPSRYAADQLERLRILLVEDDEGDAFLVRELLTEAEAPFELTVASSLREARGLVADKECILLDLGLPDAEGIDGLRKLLAVAGSSAVCVLTGRSDEHLGVQAVAEGAQDYLVKGQVDGVLLVRSLRYAVERKRADENARRLRDVELLQAESARLERGLLPKPLMRTDEVSVETFYRSGRALGLLGGDFFDVVQAGDERLHVIVGDVCGHGVDEAALGAELRVAWRALVIGGVPEDQVLPSLEKVLMSERRAREVFVTVAAVVIDLPARKATVRLAGHPPPVLLSGGRAHPVAARTGIVLGVRPTPTPATELELTGDDWSLLMYTDGLIEGHTGGPGTERLDVDGLCKLLDEPAAREVPLAGLPPWLVARADLDNGGPLTDDVAMLLISRGGGR
jgi:serine phosphatase RsbU (regulator of sigma subunit)